MRFKYSCSNDFFQDAKLVSVAGLIHLGLSNKTPILKSVLAGQGPFWSTEKRPAYTVILLNLWRLLNCTGFLFLV